VFISDEVLLDVSFAAAQARLANLARGGSLLSASQAAYGDGITGLARVGPLGAVGDGLDRVILHRVAAETARAFMNRVAGAIAHPGGAAERERGLAGAAPSWLPPAAGAA